MEADEEVRHICGKLFISLFDFLLKYINDCDMRKKTTPDLDFDRQHIWHPYTTMLSPPPVYPVVAADGCRLTLADGRELIDGMSSWWSVIHGYNHPVINKAATTGTRIK